MNLTMVVGKLEGLAEGEAKESRRKSRKDWLKVKRKEKPKDWAEGELKGKMEIAKAMLNSGMSSAMIAQYTGLTIDQIDLVHRHIR